MRAGCEPHLRICWPARHGRSLLASHVRRWFAIRSAHRLVGVATLSWRDGGLLPAFWVLGGTDPIRVEVPVPARRPYTDAGDQTPMRVVSASAAAVALAICSARSFAGSGCRMSRVCSSSPTSTATFSVDPSTAFDNRKGGGAERRGIDPPSHHLSQIAIPGHPNCLILHAPPAWWPSG